MRFNNTISIVALLVVAAGPATASAQSAEPPVEEGEVAESDDSDAAAEETKKGSADAEDSEEASDAEDAEGDEPTETTDTDGPAAESNDVEPSQKSEQPESEQPESEQPESEQPESEQPADADAPKRAEKREEADDEEYGPALPEGMSLDDVLTVAAQPPPADFPRTIPDDRFYVFLLGEQLEYRAEDVDGAGHAGLEWQAWAGGDFNKLWLKTDAEAAFVDETEVEAENDLLYSRLITPFWNLQVGAQYALGWADDRYEDRWSAALALQGMAPGSFEVDASLYFSEGLDFTGSLSLEYDLRITQRLVLQPHAEFSFSAQEVPERGLGVGLTEMKLDGRLRYEIRRDFAPYLGVRYQQLAFGTADFAREAGGAPSNFYVLAGLRFAL